MKVIESSELIVNSDGSIFHLHIRPEELADTVILVGDPGRVEMVASLFENREFTRSSREFVAVTGNYKGKRMTILSTGIGTDNIDIVLNELDALANIDLRKRVVREESRKLTILRIGTSGAIQKDIPLGSYVLSDISLGFDGLLNWYGGRDSVCDREMERMFVENTGWPAILPSPYFIHSGRRVVSALADFTIKGITISAPGFYAPQGRVLRLPLAMKNMLPLLESFRYKGNRITNFEMEGSAIAGLSALMGHEAATVCCIIANRYLGESRTDYKELMYKLIENSLDRLKEL
jgi:uridine phosphorylase